VSPLARDSENEVLWNASRRRGSVRLDARELDHLGPFLGVLGNELAVAGGRAWKYDNSQFGKSGLQTGIRQSRVHMSVELIDDLDRGTSGRDDALKSADHVAGEVFAHGRDIGQSLPAGCRGHRQRPQLSGADLLDGAAYSAEIDLHLSTNEVGNCWRVA